MLTPRENLIETIHGGHPDRYVNQFEPFALQWGTPQDLRYPEPAEPGPAMMKTCFGVTMYWPEGTPGPFPVHDDAHLVLKDITHWQDYVKIPDANFTDAEWEPLLQEAEKVDRSQYFVTDMLWPGLFETCHHLMGMEDCMINLYEEPECMHDLIAALTEYQLRLAEQLCSHMHPDAIYRHDDWGSQNSTFMSRDMFQEFYKEPTKQIYDYYKSHGVELIIHHSDSFCETFVPDMVDMGIDIWQGAMSTNNIPKIIEEYGGKLTIMGGIDNGIIDRQDWTKESVDAEVERICKWAGKRYFIPNTTYGGPISTYQGVYEEVTAKINQLSMDF